MSEFNVDLIKFAGIIFGDGYITKQGNVKFQHSILQKDYALFKAIKCEEYFGLKYSKYQRRKQENSFSTNDNFIINCHAKNWVKILRNQWYINSTKIIPCDIISRFGFEEWSFIYQDDGRLNKISHTNNLIDGIRTRKETSPWVNRYEICLGYPSDDQLSALQISLKNLNIDSSILNRKDGQRNISISKASSKIIFYENIKSFIFNSMQYKIDINPTLSYSK